MESHTKTTTEVLQAKWTPRHQATKPAVFPPHPPLQSGGWYRGSVLEAPGPGRPPVVTRQEKSVGLAVLLTVLFGPLGLCYLSVGGGLVATVVVVAVLGQVSAGFLPLVVLWPLTVAAAAWGVSRRS
jgi:hypothetical protein